jgi:hypothetical protein
MRCVVIEPDGIRILRAIDKDLPTDVREIPMIFLNRLAQGLITVLILIFQVHASALIIHNGLKILLLVEIYKFNEGYFLSNGR